MAAAPSSFWALNGHQRRCQACPSSQAPCPGGNTPGRRVYVGKFSAAETSLDDGFRHGQIRRRGTGFPDEGSKPMPSREQSSVSPVHGEICDHGRLMGVFWQLSAEGHQHRARADGGVEALGKSAPEHTFRSPASALIPSEKCVRQRLFQSSAGAIFTFMCFFSSVCVQKRLKCQLFYCRSSSLSGAGRPLIAITVASRFSLSAMARSAVHRRTPPRPYAPGILIWPFQPSSPLIFSARCSDPIQPSAEIRPYGHGRRLRRSRCSVYHPGGLDF